MKKTNWKKTVVIGVLCVLALLCSVGCSLAFNDGRLVEPMDFSAYDFRAKDLPMWISVSLVCFYAVWIAVNIIRGVVLGRGQSGEKRARKLNPWLGLLGFLGFLGFAGLWTYGVDGTVFPFCFFLFFGFFGFFFEGKMSGTLMDERFDEDRKKADLKAFKTGFVIIFLLLLVVGQGGFDRSLGRNAEHAGIFLLIGLSLTCGLVIFLREYLFYLYDHDEKEDEE